MNRNRSLFAASALALVGASATPAHAGGFLTARFGADDGNATSTTVQSTYFNPAGLAMRGGTRITAEGLVGYRTVSYDRPEAAIDNVVPDGTKETGTPQSGVGANSGHASLANLVAAPFLGVASDFGVRNLGVGLSLSVPFGGQSRWDKNEAYEGDQQYPGAVDGAQRWSVIEGEIKAVYLTLAGAYYIPAARLAIGAGFNVIPQNINIIRARTGQGTDDLVDSEGRIFEGRSWIDVSKTSFSLSGGLMWLPTDQVRVGLSYQSQPDFGPSKLKGHLRNKFGQADPTEEPGDEIQVEHALPDIYRAGVAVQVNPSVEVRGQFEWQRWSVFDKQCILTVADDARCDTQADGSSAPGNATILQNIERDFTDSWSLMGGAAWRVSPKIELSGAIIFDTSAVPDETLDGSFPDANKAVLIAGGRFGLARGLALSAHWIQAVYATRETAVVEPKEAPTRVPSSAGKYTQSVGVFSLAAEYQF